MNNYSLPFYFVCLQILYRCSIYFADTIYVTSVIHFKVIMKSLLCLSFRPAATHISIAYCISEFQSLRYSVRLNLHYIKEITLKTLIKLPNGRKMISDLWEVYGYYFLNQTTQYSYLSLILHATKVHPISWLQLLLSNVH